MSHRPTLPIAHALNAAIDNNHRTILPPSREAVKALLKLQELNDNATRLLKTAEQVVNRLVDREPEDLPYTLSGTLRVISTGTGPPQVRLTRHSNTAAIPGGGRDPWWVRMYKRRSFTPAEFFEGDARKLIPGPFRHRKPTALRLEPKSGAEPRFVEYDPNLRCFIS